MAMDGRVECCRWRGEGDKEKIRMMSTTVTLPHVPNWLLYMEVWGRSELREVEYSRGSIHEPENKCRGADFSVIPKEAFILLGAQSFPPGFLLAMKTSTE